MAVDAWDSTTTSYFDALDVGEAVGHESTAAWLENGRRRPGLAWHRPGVIMRVPAMGFVGRPGPVH
jgi:hypothetical protein